MCYLSTKLQTQLQTSQTVTPHCTLTPSLTLTLTFPLPLPLSPSRILTLALTQVAPQCTWTDAGVMLQTDTAFLSAAKRRKSLETIAAFSPFASEGRATLTLPLTPNPNPNPNSNPHPHQVRPSCSPSLTRSEAAAHASCCGGRSRWSTRSRPTTSECARSSGNQVPLTLPLTPTPNPYPYPYPYPSPSNQARAGGLTSTRCGATSRYSTTATTGSGRPCASS